MTFPSIAGFQEAAAGSPRAASLHGWGARALYLGPALNLSPHRNAVAVLALGLEAPFGVAKDPRDPSRGYRRCRSVLIEPGRLHHFRGTRGAMAFLYIDPLGEDLLHLRACARHRTPAAAFDLSIENALVENLRELASGQSDWPTVRRGVSSLLTGGGKGRSDRRIAKALAALHADPAARIPLGELAARAGLSESRFRHLFKAVTTVPLRRYRIWVAMRSAIGAIARGEMLTVAALNAGFSSSAHFSAAFRAMFGMEPSRLANGRLTMISPAP